MPLERLRNGSDIDRDHFSGSPTVRRGETALISLSLFFGMTRASRRANVTRLVEVSAETRSEQCLVCAARTLADGVHLHPRHFFEFAVVSLYMNRPTRIRLKPCTGRSCCMTDPRCSGRRFVWQASTPNWIPVSATWCGRGGGARRSQGGPRAGRPQPGDLRGTRRGGVIATLPAHSSQRTVSRQENRAVADGVAFNGIELR